ncbi:uncharacterized protein BP01DRAFT_340969 [Aspergillus saccharolyticus JOP 1030-1]|uniref:Uncharacterized protein n=1 Tax=Aspergillus saccharolyticus JOP 1030-1 TaxID=1450539 RepID=A0A318ZC32_9EURO|nr:hypothetical protein BP01DRAFT_340969 [Aspergillus saccharolyticus JOP 1030-1]PYH45031.1 hypothetical protein BP01DRAFT_340969 [Aspergillus saccharolyticus JOP 1030-1]
MSTNTEQIFLYGEAIGSELASGLNMLAFLDLNGGGILLFPAVIILTLVLTYLRSLAPMIMTGAKRCILSPAQTLLLGLHSFLRQLSTPISRQEIYHRCHASVRGMIFRSRLIQLTTKGLHWFFPSDSGLNMVGRLWGLVIGLKWMCSSILIPSYHYLTGMTAGLSPTGKRQHEDCLAAIARSGLPDRWRRKQWLESYRCTGVEAGLELGETVKDNTWRLLPLPPADGEIHHLLLLGSMVVFILIVLVGIWLWYLISCRIAAMQVERLPLVDGGTQTCESLQTTDRESYLVEMSKSLEAKNTQLRRRLAMQAAEFEKKEQRVQEAVDRQTKFMMHRVESVRRQTRNEEATVIDDLRKTISELETKLTMAKEQVQSVEEDGAAREKLQDRVVQLKKQSQAERGKILDQSQQIQSLKHEVKTRHDELKACTDKLVDVETRLAAAEEQCKQVVTDGQQLLNKDQELKLFKDALETRNEELKACTDKLLSHSLAIMQQERDAAIAEVTKLKSQFHSDPIDAELELAFAQDALQEARGKLAEAEANAQRTIEELKVAHELSIGKEHVEAEQARTQAFLLKDKLDKVNEENRTMQVQIGLATRDAQRSLERAETSERVAKVFEARLAKWEEKARDEQKIIKRQTADVGSVTTALQQCQVKVSEQQTIINELTAKLEQTKVETPVSVVEEKLRADFLMIKSMYEREKRARTEDQIRWSKQNRDLGEENQKLRISISNAQNKRPTRRRVVDCPPTPCDMD